MKSHQKMVDSETSTREYIKFGLVIWFIFLASLWPTYADGVASPEEWMRYFMAFFLATFAAFKLVGYQMFPAMFAQYDIIASRSQIYAKAYPFLQLGFSLAYAADAGGKVRDMLMLIIAAVSTVGVARAIAARKGVHCACLGNVIKLPLSTTSLVEDIGMGAMALIMLAA